MRRHIGAIAGAVFGIGMLVLYLAITHDYRPDSVMVLLIVAAGLTVCGAPVDALGSES